MLSLVRSDRSISGQFRKKPVVITAYQWFEVSPYVEGMKRDVDYYRYPPIDRVSGEVSAAADATGVQGEKYPCKPDIFAATYEPVES